MIPERTPSPGNRDTAHFPWGSRSRPARFPTFVPRPNLTTSADLKRSSWRFSRNTGSNTTQAKSGDDFSRPSRLPLCQGQRNPVQCRGIACFAREVEDQPSGNLTLNQCSSWGRLSWSRRDGRPRPSSRAKLGRFPSRRRESLILQAQEKKGQTVRGIGGRAFQSCTPPQPGFGVGVGSGHWGPPARECEGREWLGGELGRALATGGIEDWGAPFALHEMEGGRYTIPFPSVC